MIHSMTQYDRKPLGFEEKPMRNRWNNESNDNGQRKQEQDLKKQMAAQSGQNIDFHLFLTDKYITTAPYGLDVTGIFRIIPQFLSQPADENIYRSVVNIPLDIPQMIKNLISG